MTLTKWLADNSFPPVRDSDPLPGGCINQTSRLFFRDSSTAVLKQNAQAPPGFFAAEAQGLDFLRQHCDLQIPKVLGLSARFLLLEDLGSAPASADYWSGLAQGLVQLHSSVHAVFGLTQSNYCGSSLQQNTPSTDGFDFFASQRILAPAALAYDRRLISEKDLQALERIAAGLTQRLPDMPAVAVHGDLWSGNIHVTATGDPALIDPAAHWGWAEADLAMTTLFGGFHSEFFRCYEQLAGIDGSWRERAATYNLYHLLNHVLIFGEGYLGQLRQLMKEAQAC